MSHDTSSIIMLSLFDGKVCTKCKTWRLFAEFSKSSNRLDGYDFHCKACKSAYRIASHDERIARAKAFYQENRERLRAEQNKWYADNAEKIRAVRKSRRVYKQKPEGYIPFCDRRKEYNARYNREKRDQITAQKRNYRNNNRDRVRQRETAYRLANIEKKRLYRKKWQKENPDKIREHGHLRRIRKYNGGGKFTAKEWQDLKAFYGYKCLRCGKSESEVMITPDHVIPISKGGSNFISNIQPLCLPCNLSKHTDTTDYRV
jgi:5-methylcytosine-specific restriction endonuclease McrA